MQSRSDFATYQLLSGSPGVPICHLLHYLQMASEKVAKAYRFRDTDTAEDRLTTEHVAFSQFIRSRGRREQKVCERLSSRLQ